MRRIGIRALLVVTTIGGCGLFDRATDDDETLTTEQQQALQAIADPSAEARFDRVGDVYLLALEAMETLVPEVAALGGGAGLTEVLARLSGAQPFVRDTELMVYAWLAADSKDDRALGVLSDFLDANLSGDLMFATQAATHGVLSLLDDPRLDRVLAHYSGAQMAAAVAAAQAKRGRRTGALGGERDTCWRGVTLLKPDGTPLT